MPGYKYEWFIKHMVSDNENVKLFGEVSSVFLQLACSHDTLIIAIDYSSVCFLDVLACAVKRK